jgi:RNA polymerase sigma-70 factor (ECF subfamily)
MVDVATAPAALPGPLEQSLEAYRAELTGYCYRMLGSGFEAEDAVQETYIRAWRSYAGFEGRAALRTWLYRIATNVCLNMVQGQQRRARPMDLGPAAGSSSDRYETLPESRWIRPVPDGQVLAAVDDPAEQAAGRDSIRLAFIAALQYLPPRQRAVLILRDVLRWRAREVADLLGTSLVSVKSALQRARAQLAANNPGPAGPSEPTSADQQQLLARYIDAFERYDVESLVALLHEDATLSMPPMTLWLHGSDALRAWWEGDGAECRGSRVVPTVAANGSPACGSYRPGPDGRYQASAIHVLDIAEDRIIGLNVFVDPSLFPMFGLPLSL